MNNTIRVAVATYSRYSSDQQRESSITDQQRNCHERAAREGWKVVADFADAAISGSEDHRPQYDAMQAAAKRGEFGVLLVDALSRLTRDGGEQHRLQKRFKHWGVRLIAIADGLDSDQKSSQLLGAIKGAMNEQFIADLAEAVHRGQKGQALKGRWNGGRPYGYRLKRLTDPTQRDVYGEPARIGTVLERDPMTADVVAEIFQRFADGESCLLIARDLNARRIASPGSSWKRVKRRCSGWADSAVRVILHNPLYTGRQRWNTSAFVRDPDTKAYLRRRRPQIEWVENKIEALRIVSDELFARVQQRRQTLASTDPRLKSGGKAKFLLSGLLKCSVCGYNYTLADNNFYACGSNLRGRDSGHKECSNRERVRRDALEAHIVGPVNDQLLAPARVARMAKEMQIEYARRLAARSTKAAAVPTELRELEARLERLRVRLQQGDPDLAADELQAAIDRAEAKRRELQAAQPAARQSARILSMLPKAAALYRRQIELGLAGDSSAVLKARVLLHDLLGPVTLAPGKQKGELWASYRMNPAALIRGTGTVGRGDRI